MIRTTLTAAALALAATGAASANQIEPMGTYCFVDSNEQNFLDGDTSGFFAYGKGRKAGAMFYRNVGNNVYVGDARGNTYTIDKYGAVWSNTSGDRVRLLRCG